MGGDKETPASLEGTRDSYDPFEHRNVVKPNCFTRSLANLIKSSLGTGILAMPLAFANGGWLVGIIGTPIIGYICGHCVQIFVETSRACCKKDKKPSLGYSDTCYSVFINGPERCKKFAMSAYVFAELSLLFTYTGVCCIFTVLIAQSIQQPFDTYVFHSSKPIEYYFLAITIPLCLMAQIKHLKWLGPISFLANVLLVLTFGICLYYIFADEITISDKKPVGQLERVPAYLSTVIFAMEGIGVVMPVENQMKQPQRFLGCCGVLWLAMIFIGTLYTVLGVFGYFRYGDALEGSITLNLPIDHWPAICAKVFISLSIFFSYPLHFYVISDTTFRFLKPYLSDWAAAPSHAAIADITIRIVAVIFCAAIGVALPMLEQIINIVGALFYSLLGLIIPGIINTVFQWQNLGRFKWRLWKNICLVCLGFCIMLLGLTVAIGDVRKRIAEESGTIV